MAYIDIEIRLRKWLEQRSATLTDALSLLRDAHDEITRLRKRVNDLEYRERSRECVVRLSDISAQCREHLREAMADIPSRPDECADCDTSGRCTYVCDHDRPDAVKILRERASDCAKKAISWGHSGHRCEFAVLSAVADALEQERKG